MNALKKLLLTFGMAMMCFCHKKTDTLKIYGAQESATIKFDSVVTTDSLGNLLSKPNLKEWGMNDTWNIKEKYLFKAAKKPLCKNVKPDTIMVYPIPCGGTFTLTESHRGGYYWQFRWVDKDYNILWASDSFLGNRITFFTGAFKIHDTTRLYYRIVDSTCAYQGHGDIVIK